MVGHDVSITRRDKSVGFFFVVKDKHVCCFLYRRVDALKDELYRLETMTHLTKEEKEFLVKEKQDVLFKSVNFSIKIRMNLVSH